MKKKLLAAVISVIAAISVCTAFAVPAMAAISVFRVLQSFAQSTIRLLTRNLPISLPALKKSPAPRLSLSHIPVLPSFSAGAL